MFESIRSVGRSCARRRRGPRRPRAPAAQAADAAALPQYVEVSGNGHAVSLTRSAVGSGVVTLRDSTTNPATPSSDGGSSNIFRLQNGATLQKVICDLGEEFESDPAKGTRDLTHDGDFHGLADPTDGRSWPRSVSPPAPISRPTWAPRPESWLSRRSRSGPAAATARSARRRSRSRGRTATGSARRTTGPARAWCAGRTSSTRCTFLSATPAKDGTTEARMQACFDSGSSKPPAFVKNGPGYGLDVASPGRELLATYSLPHALMGMHKVITVARPGPAGQRARGAAPTVAG